MFLTVAVEKMRIIRESVYSPKLLIFRRKNRGHKRVVIVWMFGQLMTSNEINAHLFPKLSPRNCIVNFTLPRDGTSFVLSCHFTISLLIKALVWEFGQIL